ncbi:ribose 5-phosphate isomerase B [bacterium]|jgi:ribose 5-phosphate isomerase B|nr:ribose 5-phosphate isomerase B [bacterium]MBT3849906.1 ribose 5-phosphate isomerase B [bacterium]MBT4435087.1 ribose 5-phosphate isomerase B [bacterium]MDG2445856.1 ribose 5-phosphate isomerase B [Thermodesulfobacteriota bacterium]|tara:strand:- start:2848 stop:3300 length:453 start_codon:yes stop_codon:yes gene_type:complete
MKVAIGSDHRGFSLKEELKEYIHKLGFDYKDFGAFSDENFDYPDSAAEVSLKVSQGQYDRGILICASGTGMSIVANKFPNIRAVVANDVNLAIMSRSHNDCNIITLGSRYVSNDVAKNIIELWLTTDYEGGRHDVRLNKLKQIENINFEE